jgi:hypothetical protein
MSCTYTIGNKEYNSNEIKQVFSSILSVPGNEDMSNEQLVEKIKELSKDRFVDINLFDPYQETAYTNVIFSEVINSLGTLKPGQDIKVNANKMFSKIRAAFTNDYNRLKFLTDKVQTEEAYNALKQNDKILEKYPEIKVLSLDQMKQAAEQFNNVINEANWDKFVDLTRVKLNKVGLQIKDNMMEIGKIIKWMAQENIFGWMISSYMKVKSRKIKKKVKGHILIRMEKPILVNG